MRRRNPQLALRLDSADSAADRWRDGAGMAYLGSSLILHLCTDRREAMLDGEVLHLPLPPEATPRQIQDAAESWLRARALKVLAVEAAMVARGMGRAVPRVALSFADRAHWVQPDGKGGLRCHWRLIEQPAEVVAQALTRTIAELPAAADSFDLFALA